MITITLTSSRTRITDLMPCPILSISILDDLLRLVPPKYLPAAMWYHKDSLGRSVPVDNPLRRLEFLFNIIRHLFENNLRRQNSK